MRNPQTNWMALRPWQMQDQTPWSQLGVLGQSLTRIRIPDTVPNNHEETPATSFIRGRKELVDTSSILTLLRVLPKGLAAALLGLDIWRVWHILAAWGRIKITAWADRWHSTFPQLSTEWIAKTHGYLLLSGEEKFVQASNVTTSS